MRINGDLIRRIMRQRSIQSLTICRKANITPAYLGVVLAQDNAPEEIALSIAEAIGVPLREILKTEEGLDADLDET